MTGSAGRDALAQRRKRLRFRSWHRGTKELDLVLGPFADASLDDFDAALLDQYEALLGRADPDVWDWVAGRAEIPPEARSAALDRVIAFHGRPGR